MTYVYMYNILTLRLQNLLGISDIKIHVDIGCSCIPYKVHPQVTTPTINESILY